MNWSTAGGTAAKGRGTGATGATPGTGGRHFVSAFGFGGVWLQSPSATWP